MYTVNDSNERNERLYRVRKTRTQQSSRKLHRATRGQPAELTNAEKKAIHRWLRIEPTVQAGPRSLKVIPSSLLYARHHGPTSSHVLCADESRQSNAQHRGRNQASGVAANTSNARPSLSEKWRQTLEPVGHKLNTRNNVPGCNNKVKPSGYTETVQPSPGTERDADHESIGEHDAYTEPEPRDLAQAGLHGHPLR